MSPQITVVTATRNALRHLPSLAGALLRPEHDFVEWVVVDGVSDDGTVDYLKALDDPRVRWLSEPDAGIYDAWNKGVALATGRWIMFLGADDLVGTEWLRACAALPDVDLAYGDVELVDVHGSPLGRLRARPWPDVRRWLGRRMLLAHPGLAHHRSLFRSRRFDCSYKIAGDFAFLAASDLRTATQLPLVQAVVRLGGVSNRPALVATAYRENLRVLRSQQADMPWRDKLSWAVKRVLAAQVPALFNHAQALAWRMRRHP